MPVVAVVLGFTPPEWAYVTTQRSDVEISQGDDLRAGSEDPDGSADCMLATGWRHGQEATPWSKPPVRFSSRGLQMCPFTRSCIVWIKRTRRMGWPAFGLLADLGVPYAMMLYERFLGRPFAGHRDLVSELVGEGAINSDRGCAGSLRRQFPQDQACRAR